MIIGIGIDQVQAKRMKDMLLKWADRVEDRVFDEEELLYSRDKGSSHLHLAARFAAKEAFFKAVGKGLREGMTWTDVVVSNDPMGRPILNLKRRAKEIAEAMGVVHIHISLTHTDECAIALVVLEK